MKPQRIQHIFRTIKSSKNKARGITLPNFKIYYKTVISKAVWPLV